MEKIQLEISLSDDELKTAMSRYHYEDADFLLFSQVYVEIMERLRPVGMYVYGPFRQDFRKRMKKRKKTAVRSL